MTAVPYCPGEIPIVFSSTDFFAPYMSVTVQSVIDNADSRKNYHFFVLHQNISSGTIETLQQHVLFNEQFKIDFINISSWLEGSNFFIDNKYHIAVETYFRLLIPELFSQYEKVIYLDGDIICLTDISELYAMEIGDNWVASTRDILGIGSYYCYGANSNNKNKALFDGIKAMKMPDQYFCAGVIIFNIKQWKMPLKELQEFAVSRKWLFYDQDILNVICEGKTFLLPLEYQFTDISYGDPYHFLLSYLPPCIRQDYDNAQKSPKIIHFNSNVKKPWNVPYNVPYFEKFWGYANKTPFIKTIISRMNEKGLVGIQENLREKKNNDGIRELFLPSIAACFLFPWYIYKSFHLLYELTFPERTILVLCKAYLFFPYYILKIYKTLLLRQIA